MMAMPFGGTNAAKMVRASVMRYPSKGLMFGVVFDLDPKDTPAIDEAGGVGYGYNRR